MDPISRLNAYLAPATPWIARTVSLLLIITVGHWVRVYLDGVAAKPIEDGKGGNDTGKLFNWHPILMTLAFGVFMAEAVLTYQAPLVSTLSRPARKKVHATCHSLALVCALVGVTAAYKSHTLKLPTPIPNLYSPHSFLGLTALCLLGLQYLVGFTSYLWPQASLPFRQALGPLHKFGGRLTWVSGLAAMAVGLQEKATFVASGKGLSGDALFSPIIRLPAIAELLLVLLAALVLYTQVPPARVAEEERADRAARQGLLSQPTEDAYPN